jgi:hypothetical protein
MASRDRSAAARRNEALAEGKKPGQSRQEYAMGADRHVRAAARLVLSNESKLEFEELEKAHYVRFQPRNEVESDFVDDIVAARWRLRRAVCGVKIDTMKLYRNIDIAVAELRRMQKNIILQNEGNSAADGDNNTYK